MSAPEAAACGAALDRLGAALGVGAGPRTFYEAVASEDEPHELGVALTLDGAAALVSYNPRVRGGPARERMLAALGNGVKGGKRKYLRSTWAVHP